MQLDFSKVDSVLLRTPTSPAQPDRRCSHDQLVIRRDKNGNTVAHCATEGCNLEWRQYDKTHTAVG